LARGLFVGFGVTIFRGSFIRSSGVTILRGSLIEV
jgi:hypothetical protein